MWRFIVTFNVALVFSATVGAQEKNINPDPAQIAAEAEIAPIVTAANGLSGPLDVSGTSPASPSGSADIAGPRFVCQGVEPFWTLRIEQLGMSLDLAGSGVSTYSKPQAAASANSSTTVTGFFGSAPSGDFLSAIIVEARENGGRSCDESISGHEFRYSVFLNLSGRIFDGCCWMER